jgi:hypothetical protein
MKESQHQMVGLFIISPAHFCTARKEVNELVEVLVSEGYPEDRAKQAINMYNGDLALATNWLEQRISYDADADTAPTTSDAGEVYLANLLAAKEGSGRASKFSNT